jgi:hypothetical protein
MNATYDWDMLASVTAALPAMTFLFIGPVLEQTSLMAEVLARPNVRHLGARPHGSLPAYIQHSAVLLNPLAVNEHNDRRSPLRLYDYLTTSAFVVSTAVHEAHVHEGHVAIGSTVAEMIELISRGAASPPGRLEQRREYILRNTWQARGRQMISHMSEVA